MELSAFQLSKNNSRTNLNSRLHDTPIVQYARIIKIIDIQTVVAETVIQTSLSREVYTVSLLNLSSALLEINAYPKLGDTVLLLFLQRHDPRMFIEKTVNNPNAAGYNQFSGVGVLMSTVRNTARTIVKFYEDGGEPVAEINSNAEAYSTFNNLMTVTFCRAVMNSEDEQLITVCFGQGRPFIQQFLSRVEREHGFWYDNDGELVELDASVTEKYSRYAPIAKDVQGTQDFKIGIDGNGEDTEAAVTAKLGGKAEINIESASGLTMKFEKAVLAECGDSYELQITGPITVSSGQKITVSADDDVVIKSKGKYYIGNSVMDAYTLLMDLVSEIKSLQTFGPPPLHKVHPVSKVSLTAYEQEIDSMLMPEG